MRVLHVTEAFGGGIQSAIANYVDGLGDVDHSLYSRARDAQSTWAWPGGSGHEVYAGGLVGFFVRLLAKVREEKPDVVHLHSSFAGLARALLPPRQPVVYSPHCYAMERRDVPAPVLWTFALAEFLLARRRQSTAAVSLREATLSWRLNWRTPRILVLNPAPFAMEPVQRPRDTGTDEIVMVGRISPQKDPHLFAEVARACTGRPWHFVWIGDGEAEDRADLEDAGVEVTGWTQPERLAERLADATLYLHSGAWEGGPVSTVEAASLGVPVIARDIPSMKSLGYPVAGDGPGELAEGVTRFFTDSSYADDVARRSVSVASAATRASMSASLLDAYTSAIVRTSRGRPRAR